MTRGGWGEEMPIANQVKRTRQASLGRATDARTLLLKLDPSRPFTKDYRTIGRVGHGAYGSVYSVELKRKPGEIRASKEILLTTDEDRRFAAVELQVMLKLDHPNILKLYEYFEDHIAIYLICELCTGGDYKTLMAEPGEQHDMEDIRSLYLDVFKALAYCHDQHVAHRDMKFENCMIDEKSQSQVRMSKFGKSRMGKVIDFGLAAIKAGKDGDNWMNAFLGTRFFIAPEIVDKSIKYGVKCDVWAVGVMLYLTLTDEHPVAKGAWNLDMKAFFTRVKEYTRMRTEPFKHNHHVGSSLQSLLKGLLEKDANKRLSAAKAVEHDWFKAASQLRDTTLSSIGTSLASMSNKSVDTSTPSSSSDIMKRAMTFRQANQFEKAILSIAAYQEATAEIDVLREQFIALDTAGNGTLSKAELAKGIKDAGVVMSPKEISKIFDALDADRTGKVHFTEFLAGTLNPSEVASDKAISDVFNFFDLDRSGKVNRRELCEVLGNEAEASSLLSKAQARGRDYLSKEDFARVMKDIAAGMETRYNRLE